MFSTSFECTSGYCSQPLALVLSFSDGLKHRGREKDLFLESHRKKDSNPSPQVSGMTLGTAQAENDSDMSHQQNGSRSKWRLGKHSRVQSPSKDAWTEPGAQHHCWQENQDSAPSPAECSDPPRTRRPLHSLTVTYSSHRPSLGRGAHSIHKGRHEPGQTDEGQLFGAFCLLTAD